jgi:hypothetical protein
MKLRIWVKDPSEKTITGDMETKAVVFVRLNTPYDELRKDRGRPISQAINDAIIDITGDWRVAETWDKEAPPSISCCARCSAGLFTKGCQQCGITVPFTGMLSFDRNPPPLPQKVVDFLVRQGHVFVTDPREAQRLEAAQW